MDLKQTVIEQPRKKVVKTVETTTLQECECAINRLSLSNIPRLEFDGLGCHSLLLPLLLQSESCG